MPRMLRWAWQFAAMLPHCRSPPWTAAMRMKFAWMFSPRRPILELWETLTQPIFEGGTLLHRKRAADDALKQAAAPISEQRQVIDVADFHCRRVRS